MEALIRELKCVPLVFIDCFFFSFTLFLLYVCMNVGFIAMRMENQRKYCSTNVLEGRWKGSVDHGILHCVYEKWDILDGCGWIDHRSIAEGRMSNCKTFICMVFFC